MGFREFLKDFKTNYEMQLSVSGLPVFSSLYFALMKKIEQKETGEKTGDS